MSPPSCWATRRRPRPSGPWSRPTTCGSTGRCGRPWPTPACSASPCPPRWAAPASACSSCAWCWRGWAGVRRPAPVPALAALALGGLPLARFGTADQQARWLPGLAAGTTVLTAALVEPSGDPTRPTTTATRDGDGGWILAGERTNVPAGLVADDVLVPATTDGGETAVFVV